MNERSTTGETTTDGVTIVELVVGGMHCSSCAALIEETLADEPAVSSAAVDLEATRAVVAYDPSTTTVADLCAVVEKAGYLASPAPPGGATP